MLTTISASNFNLFEGIFWICLGMITLLLTLRVPTRYSTLALFATSVLITFGISDFVQVHYGSFLVPGMEWLYVWKIADVIGLIVCVVWYVYLRITQSKSTASSIETGQ